MRSCTITTLGKEKIAYSFEIKSSLKKLDENTCRYLIEEAIRQIEIKGGEPSVYIFWEDKIMMPIEDLTPEILLKYLKKDMGCKPKKKK